MDILADGPIRHDSIIESVEVNEKASAEYAVEYGDMLVQRSSKTCAEVGQSNVYLDFKSALFGGFVIRAKAIPEYDPSFLKNALMSSPVQRQITNATGGSTDYNVSQGILEADKLHLPSLPEQRKIAAFSSAVNARLWLLERRVALVTKWKREVLEEVFSTKAMAGREEVRLGDICTFRKGTGILKADISKDGKTPCVHYGELYTDYGEAFDTPVSKTEVPVGEPLLS